MTDPNAPTPTVESIRLELDKASSVVATAAKLSAQGRTVDLSALEAKVANACRAIGSLPRDDARTLLPMLEALLKALDSLEDNLKARFAAGMDGSHVTTAAAPRAAAAYSRNQPTPPMPTHGQKGDNGG